MRPLPFRERLAAHASIFVLVASLLSFVLLGARCDGRVNGDNKAASRSWRCHEKAGAKHIPGCNLQRWMEPFHGVAAMASEAFVAPVLDAWSALLDPPRPEVLCAPRLVIVCAVVARDCA